jgi:hypothetical protein
MEIDAMATELVTHLLGAIDQRDHLLRSMVAPCRNALLFTEQVLETAKRGRLRPEGLADLRATLIENAENFARVLLALEELTRAHDELRANLPKV